MVVMEICINFFYFFTDITKNPAFAGFFISTEFGANASFIIISLQMLMLQILLYLKMKIVILTSFSF